MIPDFTPILKTPQNHIHLGLVPVDGSDPEGFGDHGEPPYTFTAVINRMPIFNVVSSYDRAWDLTPFAHLVRDVDGKPIIPEDFQYELLVDDIGMQILKRLFKNYVYLVDNRHCADSEDHTMYVNVMWFSEFNYGDHLDPLLTLNNVTVTFLDAYTVSPLS